MRGSRGKKDTLSPSSFFMPGVLSKDTKADAIRLVYKILKKEPYLTLLEISDKSEIPICDIGNTIKGELSSGRISTRLNGVRLEYFVTFLFFPMEKSPDSGFWNFSDVIKRWHDLGEKVKKSNEMRNTEGGSGDVVQTVSCGRPPEHTNSVLKWIVHRGQGQSPTCVGQTVAEMMDVLYMTKVGNKPEKTEITKNKHFEVGSKSFLADVLYDTSFSAACAYQKAREIGRSFEQGAYIDAGMVAAQRIGTCRDWQWACPKDQNTVLTSPFPDVDPVTGDTASTTCSQHKIDGFARCNTIDDIKQAIFEKGCVAGAIKMFSNYTSAYGGTLAHPGAMDVAVGGHAVLFVGYDRDGVKYLDSWRDEGYPVLIKVPDSYLSSYLIDAFAPLDSEESSFAREYMYKKVTVTSNRVGSLWINGQKFGALPCYPELRVGTGYLLKVVDSAGYIKETNILVLGAMSIEITFDGSENKVSPGGGSSGNLGDLESRISARINAVLERLKKRFGGI